MTAEADPPVPEPPLDRGISPVSGRARRAPARLVLLAALGLGGGALALAAARPTGPAPEQSPSAAARELAPFEPAPRRPPATPPPPVGTPDAPVDLTPPEVPASDLPPPPGAPLLAFRAGGSEPRTPAATPVQRSDPPAVAVVRAGRLPDRRLVLLAGARLPCILETALDSAVPGPATCLLADDVWGEDGTVVLLERGARLLGEHRGGLRAGDRRLAVSWTRIVTPAGVAADLAAPAVDPLGRAGLPGVVDNRWGERLGPALLVSLVEGAAGRLARRGPWAWLAAPGASATTEALRAGREVAPRVAVPPGAEIGVLTTRDLDFSEVYALAAAP
ncbi:TrbI/VirB10 family protein [Phenylobacterium deserti]|uniref:Type IV secretion system protein VirB10 n=1 Tax=Phenylobacterium deserti TaxID=1914756 RepID=A0A328ADP5_9CAUL|nr:TrbI/VirB10 family protein [Phenylobacterium deserti]RAK52770.1 type IV secretion system protein VirB10 [Phenylobacterium deserti]